MPRCTARQWPPSSRRLISASVGSAPVSSTAGWSGKARRNRSRATRPRPGSRQRPEPAALSRPATSVGCRGGWGGPAWVGLEVDAPSGQQTARRAAPPASSAAGRLPARNPRSRSPRPRSGTSQACDPAGRRTGRTKRPVGGHQYRSGVAKVGPQRLPDQPAKLRRTAWTASERAVVERLTPGDDRVRDGFFTPKRDAELPAGRAARRTQAADALLGGRPCRGGLDCNVYRRSGQPGPSRREGGGYVFGSRAARSLFHAVGGTPAGQLGLQFLLTLAELLELLPPGVTLCRGLWRNRPEWPSRARMDASSSRTGFNSGWLRPVRSSARRAKPTPFQSRTRR